MNDTDKEIEAIRTMVPVLEGIEDLEVRKRILWYLTDRFGKATKPTKGTP
jgi:hypothetical protein